MNAHLAAAWTGDNGYRDKVCRFAALGPFILPNNTGNLLEEADPDKSVAYSNSEMKKRGLLPGLTVKNPLTIWVAPTTVHISINLHTSAPGGWFVVTAYPSIGD